MNEVAWDKLCGYLSSLKPCPIRDASQLQDLLCECWDDIDGTDQERTAAYKLRGRMKNVEWDPPELAFTLPRHGGTVLGSTREALHRWGVDTQARRATCNPRYSHRQVEPMAAPVRAKPLAAELVAAIAAREDDDRLKWSDDCQRVKVNLTEAVGGSKGVAKQTLEGRRKRLRDELIRVLPEEGWVGADSQGAVFEFKG